LAINETPILTIKKLMNHNDISTTMKYANCLRIVVKLMPIG